MRSSSNIACANPPVIRLREAGIRCLPFSNYPSSRSAMSAGKRGHRWYSTAGPRGPRILHSAHCRPQKPNSLLRRDGAPPGIGSSWDTFCVRGRQRAEAVLAVDRSPIFHIGTDRRQTKRRHLSGECYCHPWHLLYGPTYLSLGPTCCYWPAADNQSSHFAYNW